jgi:hypothetical protein
MKASAVTEKFLKESFGMGAQVPATSLTTFTYGAITLYGLSFQTVLLADRLVTCWL